jgi:hypothetical protein
MVIRASCVEAVIMRSDGLRGHARIFEHDAKATHIGNLLSPGPLADFINFSAG